MSLSDRMEEVDGRLLRETQLVIDGRKRLLKLQQELSDAKQELTDAAKRRSQLTPEEELRQLASRFSTLRANKHRYNWETYAAQLNAMEEEVELIKSRMSRK